MPADRRASNAVATPESGHHWCDLNTNATPQVGKGQKRGGDRNVLREEHWKDEEGLMSAITYPSS